MRKESNYSEETCIYNRLSIKRFLNVFFVVIFVISFMLPTFVSEAATPKTTKLTMSKTSVSVYKGQKYQLKVTKANTKVKHKTIKWTTSNKKVVTVNQKGYIKGVKKGTAYVYCKVTWTNKKSTTVKCKVKVYNPVKLKSYKLSKTSVKLKVGEKTTVKKIINPTNATIIKTAISTSNKKVAIINSKGVITAKGVGTAKVCMAIKTYDNKVYKKYVTVKVSKKEVAPTSVKFDRISSGRYVGGAVELETTLLPANATNKKITYVSSNTAVAKISNVKDVSATGTTGKLTVLAVGVGSATITAKTSNGKVATYSIVVKEPYAINIDKKELELKEETSGNVKTTVTRYDGEAKAIEYSSSNTKVATVDKEGQVIGVSEGTATITASVVNPTAGVPDKFNKVTCTVKVTKADVASQYIKEPYISTYYFDPRPDYSKEVKIPVYVTDTDNTEYLLEDDSKRFDIILEVDGKVSYIRDMKPGDNDINLGKLSKGDHYFALQVIDKENGLKSHKLYNELYVIDPEEYAIKESETYYMTEADLEKYNIDNTNNLDESVCIETRKGLNQLFIDTKEAGYRKIVLLKGIYRVEGEQSRDKSLDVPSYFTVDLNGATFKLNTVEENNVGVVIFQIQDKTEAHVTNGILEGDRVERKEMGLENGYNGEPINTFGFRGSTRCSFTNLVVKQTTGHTAGTSYVWGPGTKISSYTKVDIVDGKEVPCDSRSTSNMIDLTKMKAWSDYVSIGQAEGYRGLKGESPILYVHFYDTNKEYMFTQVGYQFRKIRIPKEAVYSRVTMLGELTVEHNVSYHCKHLGEYLEFSGIDFYDTRTTALAPSACNNLLIEDITYTRAGNSITPCAVDFEDGWQECQDVYYRNVEVLEASGTATLIDNSGYNHVYENLKGHRIIIRRGVMGSVIKNCENDNDMLGNIHWTYGNYINSKYNRVYNVKTGNISVDVSEADIERGTHRFLVKDCKMDASYISSTNDLVLYKNCIFRQFNGSKLNIEDSVIYPTSYLGDKLYFKNCIFKNLEEEGGSVTFRFNALDAVRKFDNCTFYGETNLVNNNNFNTGEFNNCTFEDVRLKIGASSEENKPGIIFNKCNIKSKGEQFIYLGPYAYSTGRYNVEFNNSNIELSEGLLLYMYATPTLDSKIVFNNCKIKKSGGTLFGGWGTVTNKTGIALDVIFNKCDVDKNMDASYIGTGNGVNLIFN